MRIALIGNPNSGKTTMYNALTGSNQKVGNWAGVTVDKKEHKIKKMFSQNDITAVDLPGAYSMSAFTSEEGITGTYIKTQNPDVIINIVDATNLNRSLFFTTQLAELGIPMVVALNKTDIGAKTGETDVELLTKELGCPVLETVSLRSKGLKEVITTAEKIVGNPPKIPYHFDDDKDRFRFVNRLVKRAENRKYDFSNTGDKIDRIITNRWFGIPIFAVVMFLVFQISQVWVGTPIADLLVGLLENFQSLIGNFITDQLLYSVLIDGIFGGVIAVIGFLPLVMIMYFLISLLEDCGYMSRVSVVLDPIFKKVGLSGKSVIPFVISVGCAVPGVMASRTIRDERQRKFTVMLAPFMPCGAKIPVISLFAGIFFGNAGWVSTLMYFSGIVIVFFAALLINKITAFKEKNSYFIIELPEYKLPSLKIAFKSMISRGWAYIVKAATIILVCNTAVQIMQSFNWNLTLAQTADSSILATVAKPFAYALVPIVGVVSWQLAAATVTGLIAKENIVATLAVCFSVTNFIDTEELTLLGGGNEVAAVMGITKAAALGFLMFNLFSPPCFAAIGAMNAEMKSKKWLFAGLGLQLFFGFTTGFLAYQIGTLFTLHKLGGGFLSGLSVITVTVLVIAVVSNKRREKCGI